jgi:hypothetical protein
VRNIILPPGSVARALRNGAKMPIEGDALN